MTIRAEAVLGKKQDTKDTLLEQGA